MCFFILGLKNIVIRLHEPPTSTEGLSFMQSKRGEPTLVYNGYEHTKKRVNKNNSTSWRCANRTCNGGMLTDHENTIMKITPHVCTPDLARIAIKEELFRCRQEAAFAENKPISSIYYESVEKLRSKGIDTWEVPALSQVKTSFYNARKKSQGTKTLLKMLDTEQYEN